VCARLPPPRWPSRVVSATRQTCFVHPLALIVSQPASQPATHTHTHSQPAAQSRRLAVAIPSPCASDHRYELQRPFVEALQRLSWGYAVLQPRLRLQHQR
jgi:hypothetical protein